MLKQRQIVAAEIKDYAQQKQKIFDLCKAERQGALCINNL